MMCKFKDVEHVLPYKETKVIIRNFGYIEEYVVRREAFYFQETDYFGVIKKDAPLYSHSVKTVKKLEPKLKEDEEDLSLIDEEDDNDEN